VRGREGGSGREEERGRERGGERERERECVCVFKTDRQADRHKGGERDREEKVYISAQVRRSQGCVDPLF
jgi:hypothetical protein